MRTITYDSLEVRTYASREELGDAAASLAAEAIREACAAHGTARVVFACAPSQTEFLAALVRRPIAWRKVAIFHMDEYLRLTAEEPHSNRNFLRSHLLDHIDAPLAVHCIQGENDPMHECALYSRWVAEKPFDFVCMGIGENGHLAFNDPPAADFCDPRLVKIVDLDEDCRRQQVNDGRFPNLETVPTRAITLTIPALMSARHISCCAPGERKAQAVYDTLHTPISKSAPASILRRHPRAILHLDPASASLLEE